MENEIREVLTTKYSTLKSANIVLHFLKLDSKSKLAFIVASTLMSACVFLNFHFIKTPYSDIMYVTGFLYFQILGILAIFLYSRMAIILFEEKKMSNLMATILLSVGISGICAAINYLVIQLNQYPIIAFLLNTTEILIYIIGMAWCCYKISSPDSIYQIFSPSSRIVKDNFKHLLSLFVAGTLAILFPLVVLMLIFLGLSLFGINDFTVNHLIAGVIFGFVTTYIFAVLPVIVIRYKYLNLGSVERQI